jgi:hypothetical protein
MEGNSFMAVTHAITDILFLICFHSGDSFAKAAIISGEAIPPLRAR